MDKNKYIILILAIGSFGIVNTQLGVVGILPLIAETYQVSISQASLMISLFALAAAISGPTLPLLLSGINRRKVMLFSLGVFLLSNIVILFATSFTTVLVAYVLPAFLLPVYFSQALTMAAASVPKEQAPKAISRVFIGIVLTMVVGVPLTTFVANAISLQAAILGFGLVNAVAFLATFFGTPSVPVEQKMSYGKQLKILKKAVLWLSLLTVVLMNGAIFGVYSYITEFLGSITRVTPNEISLMLFVYGVANIFGNVLSGKLVSKYAAKCVVFFPYILGIIYTLIFLIGNFALPMTIIIFSWGILGGMGGIIFQHWITSAAPEAPDFANGLFITSANLGTTIATMFCGLIIGQMGIGYVSLGGIFFLIISVFVVLLRLHLTKTQGDSLSVS